jgi:hypothetical protein
MARPRIADLDRRIAEIAQHSADLPPEATSPIEHYNRASNDAWNLLLYVDRNVRRAKVYPAVAERHFSRLRGMVLLGLVEAFERYVKEAASVCADHVVPLVLDNADRLAPFRVQPASLAAHFSAQSLGRALCEGDTWLDCDDINKRFRRLLAKPFEKGGFEFFPTNSAADKDRMRTVETLWQLRHTLAHNLGMVTRSDAAKLRLLTKGPIDAPKILAPRGPDVWYAKNFLDDATESANSRVATALSTLLTDLRFSDPTLFDPQTRADELARQFRVQVTVAGAVGTP